MVEKFISTTALSKELKIPTKDLFKILEDSQLIKREDNKWLLTEEGIKKGGTIKKHPQYGSYIAWNEEIKGESIFSTIDDNQNFINATTLGSHFGISKFRINPILSELGLVEKSIKGWTVTSLGKSHGGKQFEYEKTGIPYVCWDRSILENKRIIDSLKEIQGDIKIEVKAENDETTDSFRGKFEAKHRSADGHYVRSRAEMLIDNWLYMSEIVHAYERKLPIEEDVYCDFYLPVGKVYIEFWGLENDPKYMKRKEEKIRIYQKYGFNLIELIDEDIQNLDDILPKKLLKFGIQTY